MVLLRSYQLCPPRKRQAELGVATRGGMSINILKTTHTPNKNGSYDIRLHMDVPNVFHLLSVRGQMQGRRPKRVAQVLRMSAGKGEGLNYYFIGAETPTK